MKKKASLLGTLLVLAASLGLVGCQQINARMEIKEANQAYENENYDRALQHYLAAQQIDASFVDLDRLIGYSYIGTFKPEDESPANQKVADKAIAHLLRYLKKRPDDATAREALINLYLNANRTDQAINFFKQHLESKPNDLDAVKSIATLYAKSGNFAESLRWYQRITLLDSRNPEVWYIYGVVLYEKVAKNPDPDQMQNFKYIEEGKVALQKAADLRKDYFEAIVYTNLLFREQAKREIDPIKQQELLAKADEYRNRAVAITRARKAQEAGASGAAPPAPAAGGAAAPAASPAAATNTAAPAVP
jgi:tetratricopeptide (TPR) repeat protein